MKKLTIYCSAAILVALLVCETICAQALYQRLKITTKEGLLVEGRKGIIGREKVSLFVGGVSTEYSLDEVNMIMAKKGRSGSYAGAFAGGCFAISLLTVISNPNDDDQGELLAGALLWTGIFAGIGAAIGAMADPWKPVYTRQYTSVLNRFDLSFKSYKEAPYNVGIVYKFRQ